MPFFIYLCRQNRDDDDTDTFFNNSTFGAELIAFGSVRLKKAYHELEIANKRAQELSRMKSDFIQQISHEIRTPLNILSGFTQVLTMSDAKLDEAMRQEIKGKITENTESYH